MNIKTLYKFLFILTIFVTLSSCAIFSGSRSTKIDINKPTQSEKNYQHQFLDNYISNGVIGIIHNGKAESASFYWQQNGDKFSLRVYGPLGFGAVKVEGDSRTIVFTDKDGKANKVSDVRAYMQQNFGWYIPIKLLQKWLQAIPEIHSEFTSTLYKNTKLIKILEQFGWNINYSGYSLLDGEYILPSKLRMTRDNISVKMVVKNWQIT